MYRFRTTSNTLELHYRRPLQLNSTLREETSAVETFNLNGNVDYIAMEPIIPYYVFFSYLNSDNHKNSTANRRRQNKSPITEFIKIVAYS